MALVNINWNPTNRELRQFGTMLLVFFGVVGAVVYSKTGSLQVASYVWIPAGLAGLLGLAVPQAIKWLFIGWIVAAFPIGWTVSHLLLGFLFYFVITPIGLLMRVVGYDPMKRKFEPDASTYWVKRDPLSEPARYFRQF